MQKSRLITGIILAISMAFATASSEACTSFVIKSNDGGYVYGRTLEFGIDLQSVPIAIPRNFSYAGTGVDNKPGKVWKTKYAAIGMNGIHLPVLVDGMNEKGLSGGMLYAPNTAEYQDVSADDSANSIASYEMLTYALTNFATVDEAREAFQHIMINKTGHAPFKGAVPVHMTLHDATGKNLVIEYHHGKLAAYDNPTGAMTNDPDFAYHLANIGLYANLSSKESAPLMVNGTAYSPPSSGSGLHGLPGDFLSPSRFIRVVMYSSAASTALPADAQVVVAFHILNNFDIPPGAIQLSSDNPYGGGGGGFERTEWLSVADAKNLVYYVKTFENPTVQMLAMKDIDFNAKDIKVFQLQSNEVRLKITK